MKLTGAALILLGALYGRGTMLREGRRRRAAVESLRLALFRMGEEVRVRRVVMPVLLKSLSGQCGAAADAFFSAALLSMERGEPLDRAWEQAAEALPMEAADRQTVGDLAGELRGDEARLCRALSDAAARLAESGRRLDSRSADEFRRATALSLGAAALLVILLA